MPILTKRQKEDKAYALAFNLVCEMGSSAPAQLRRAAKEAKKILDDTKKKHTNDDKECPRHPLYQGKRKPKNNCRGCWRVYNANQNKK